MHRQSELIYDNSLIRKTKMLKYGIASGIISDYLKKLMCFGPIFNFKTVTMNFSLIKQLTLVSFR